MLPPLQYSDPQVLFDQASGLMEAIDQVTLFNDPTHQKLREMWCAAAFGRGFSKFIGPCQVAVNNTRYRMDGDFFLKREGCEFPFQLVECLEPARHRGEEYKRIAKGELKYLPYQPERGRIEGPGWIADTIRKKVEKNYGGSTRLNLAVYVNFSARQMNHADVVTAARPHEGRFASIWIFSDFYIGTLFEGAAPRESGRMGNCHRSLSQ